MPWDARGERRSRAMREIDGELIDAVRGYLEEGKSEREIRNILNEGPGFSDAEVNEILGLAKQPKKQSSAEKSAGGLKKSIAEAGEPIKIIRPPKKWGSLIVWNLYLAIPVGLTLAVIIAVISVLLKVPAEFIGNAALLMFPIAFVLMALGTHFKLVEYRFYTDMLIFHTHLLKDGGKTILYKNIKSITSNRKNILVRYTDEYGELETLEIESDSQHLEEDKQQLSELIKK